MWSRFQTQQHFIPLLLASWMLVGSSGLMGCSDEPVPVTETPSAPPEGTATPSPVTPTPADETATPDDETDTPENGTDTPVVPTPTPVSDDPDGDGYSEATGDCQPNNGDIHPGATEIPYDGIDQDCTGGDLVDVDEDGALGVLAGGNDCDDTDPDRFPGHAETPYDGIDQDCDGLDLTDVDQDGHPGGLENPVDCNDEDADIHPGSTEVPYDGIDQDCTGGDLNDQDQDGYIGEAANGDDCDDLDANTFPGNPEFEDDKDNNCDGNIDEALDTTDDDQDGYSEQQGDCNDGNASIHPTATETPYDGIDQDCSGADLNDLDQDGYIGSQAGGTDCNDAELSIHPGATETPYDGIDQDCSGTDLVDVDGDTYVGTTAGGDDCNDTVSQINPGSAEVPYDGIDQDCSGADLVDVDNDGAVAIQAGGTDCNDNNPNINPSVTEVCDGIDNDCSGQTDDNASDASTWYADGDGDSYGSSTSTTKSCSQPSGFVSRAGDCNDNAADINPEAKEVCDAVDNNCDGGIDEGVKSTYYQDADSDTHGNVSSSTQACSAPAGYVSSSNDCDDTNAQVYPGATETCDLLDNDCDSQVDENVKTTFYQDSDQDTYGNPNATTQACTAPSGYVTNNTDCNDATSAVNPAAPESCDSLDNDCDAQVDENVKNTYYQDLDGDTYGNPKVTTQACSAPTGYVSNNTDCADNSVTVYPGATEYCNGIDDDCDGTADDNAGQVWYRDADGDAFGDAKSTLTACSKPTGYVTNDLDCNDSNANIKPGATETCNSLDDDCDTQIDEGVTTTYYLDADSDGYGVNSTTMGACSKPSGYATVAGDCDDTKNNVNPGATEVCDSLDNDCDALKDEGVTTPYYLDADSDGYGVSTTTVAACSKPSGYVTVAGDCDDTKSNVNPGATEVCDSLDNDCDALKDEGVQITYYLDADSDGYGVTSTTMAACSKPSGYATVAGDCDDTKSSVNPGATEVCDSLDNDCDGSKDEGVQITYYLDADGDGYGVTTTTTQGCSKPSGYATVSGDCDDTKSSVNPGATEVCDSIDNDCDAKIDSQDGLTCTVKALIYYDSGATFADDAVALRSGGSSILTTTGTAFNSAYDAGGFNVIIIDAPGTSLDSGLVTRLTSWIAAGKPLIFSWWDLDTNATLQSTLGVRVVAERTSFTAIYPTSSASINLWTLQESVPVPLSGSDQAGDNGDTIATTETDGRILGSFGSTTSGQGAIALTKSGKVIVNAFLPWDTQTVDNDADGRPDMTEMYVNQLRLLGF